MQQQNLPLEDALPEPAGAVPWPRTPWKPGAPPVIGWWEVRIISGPAVGLYLGQRRWWDGKGWSIFVLPEDSDPNTAQCQLARTAISPDRLEWRGLVEAHPDGYTDEVWAAIDAALSRG